MNMKAHGLKLMLTLLLTVSSTPTWAFVHADGQNIVDADGNIVLQRGMGLGGWLVPEGYMLQTPGFGSPTSIRAQIEDVVGEAGANQFYSDYHANYVTRADIAELAAWGFDHVRMPFHYNMFSPARGVWNDWGFEVTDSLIAWCSDVGMHVVLDMHCAPGGQNGGNISDSDGTARFWLQDTSRAHAIEIWEAIAQRYVNEPWVGGYDLLNEPVLPDGVTTQDFRNFYETLVAVIRATDTNHIVFIEGNWYATDFTGLTPPFDSNMAYSFHKYWSTNNLASIQSYVNMRTQYGVPLWMSESGENSNTWFYDAIQLFEANNIGWCWWTTKKVETITSPYSVRAPAGYSLLLDYWDGNGPKPNAATSQVILNSLTENLRTSNCDAKPGVIASFFSEDFGSQPLAYADHLLPCVINTADYDIGAQGIAYYDAVYQTTQWDNYTAWNNGHVYRNDGVDIEVGDDGKPSVGWLTIGEWMKYTLTVPVGGIYSLAVEVASPSGDGHLVLYLDGEVFVDVATLPSTGGWATWQEVQFTDLAIPSGVHELKLLVAEEGFNLRDMTFTLDSADVVPQQPAVFTLGANYPNPFNGSTKLPVTFEHAGNADLQVFDIQGKEMIHYSGYFNVGESEIPLLPVSSSGTPFSAGVYVIRFAAENHVEFQKMTYLP